MPKMYLDNYDDDDLEDGMDNDIDWDAIELDASDDSTDSMPIDLDIGNAVDVEPTSIPELSGSGNDPPPSSSTEHTGSKLTETKKTAITAIVVGLCIIVTCFVLINVTRHLRQKIEKPAGGQTSSATSVEDTDTEQRATDTQVPETVETPSAQEMGDNEWVSIDDTMYLKTLKNGRFTIESIDYYGAVLGDVLQTKAVAKGTLKGVGSGFELVFPSTSKLTVGSTITVKYRTGLLNGVLVVGDIQVVNP